MNANKFRSRVVLGVLLATLCACGGGGGSTASAPPGPPPAQNPPTLTVLFPNYPALTDATDITIRGTVSDPDGDAISSITFKDSAGNVIATTAPTGTNWSEVVPLVMGRNSFEIEAIDARGGSAMMTVEAVREFFLNAVSSPVHDPIANVAYVMARITSSSPANSIVMADLATGTRTLVSDDSLGTGPALSFGSTLIRNFATDKLLVFHPQARTVMEVDVQSGNRSVLATLASAGELNGAVVDEANNRILLLDRDYGLWSVLLADGSVMSLGTAVVPSGASGPNRGLAVSSDGALLYLNAISVFAEVNLQSLSVRELPVFEILDSASDDFFLDEDRNRIVLTHYGLIFAIDRASGTHQDLLQIPEEFGGTGDMIPGRTNDEVVWLPSFKDRLIAIDLAGGTFDRLAGDDRGTGPVLDEREIVHDAASGFIYSTLESTSSDPQDYRYDLVRIDPASGDRTIIPTNYGLPVVFGMNLGMGLDANGGVIVYLNAAPQGLFRIDPDTGNAERLLVPDAQFPSIRDFCYDNQATTGYAQHMDIDSDVLKFDLDSGDTTVVSSEPRGVGAGPGPVIASGIACDSNSGRVLVTDAANMSTAVFAVDVLTGDRTIISDASIGSGSDFSSPNILSVTPDGSAVMVRDGNQLVRVDLASGNRSYLPNVPSRQYTLQILGMDIVDNDRAFIADQNGGIWSVDLVTGERIRISR